MPSFFLAWQYLRRCRLQAAVMIAGVTLALFLPLATHWLVNAFDDAIGARAAATPLVLGAKGSRFDLVLHGLYFRAEVDGNLTQGDLAELNEKRGNDLTFTIPIHRRFSAREQPVVGTSLDYFAFRELQMAEGDSLALLGDCVLGASAAASLDLHPGDKLKTDRDNLFDLAGEYPVQLNITGVLAPSGTADDEAVFIDVKTSWIIAGIGHGHDENASTAASAKLVKTFLNITPDNIFSFHFHGEPESYPLTAILIAPRNPKAMALIRNDYAQHQRLQVLKPPKVVDEMMGTVLRVRQFLDANYAFVATTTALLLALIVVLSRRLRAREMETMFLLGCSRGTLWALQAAELAMIFAAATTLALAVAWASVAWARDYLNTLTG